MVLRARSACKGGNRSHFHGPDAYTITGKNQSQTDVSSVVTRGEPRRARNRFLQAEAVRACAPGAASALVLSIAAACRDGGEPGPGTTPKHRVYPRLRFASRGAYPQRYQPRFPPSSPPTATESVRRRDRSHAASRRTPHPEHEPAPRSMRRGGPGRRAALARAAPHPPALRPDAGSRAARLLLPATGVGADIASHWVRCASGGGRPRDGPCI